MTWSVVPRMRALTLFAVYSTRSAATSVGARIGGGTTDE